jgi:hypothetical protein
MFAFASDSIRTPLLLVYLVVALAQDSICPEIMYKLNGLRWTLAISNLNDSWKNDLRSHMISLLL